MSIDPTEANLSMDCAELERTLDAYLDGELAPEEDAAASEHLSRCAGCQDRAGSAAILRTSLRARLRAAMAPHSGAGRAPDRLRESIRFALGREQREALAPARSRRLRRVPAPLGLAAAALLAVGALLLFGSRGGLDPLVEESVRKHTRDLPLEVIAASFGADPVAGWLSGKLEFDAEPPLLPAEGVRVLGARLLHLQDRPAAYVRYELFQRRLGLFIMDDPDRRLDQPVQRFFPGGGSAVRMVSARGHSVAVWRRGDTVYALVSDLEPAELRRLLQRARVPAR